MSGLRGSCLTSPQGPHECLRTDSGSRNAPAGMTEPQAEPGASGASSKPQACPDGVGVSPPKSLAPVISRTGPPACSWAALSPEGPSRPERKPAVSGLACGRVFLCRCCVTVCVCVSPILSSLSVRHSPCLSLFLPVCVCVPVCVCAFRGMRPMRPKATSCVSAWLS